MNHYKERSVCNDGMLFALSSLVMFFILQMLPGWNTLYHTLQALLLFNLSNPYS